MRLIALFLLAAASQLSLGAEPTTPASPRVSAAIDSAVRTHKAKDHHCLVSHQMDVAGNAHPESVEAHTEANYIGVEKDDCPSDDKRALSVVPPGR